MVSKNSSQYLEFVRVLIFEVMLFTCSCKNLPRKYLNVFTCSSIVLCVTLLLLIGTCPSNIVILDFLGNMSFQIFLLILSKVYDALFLSPSESDRSTWFLVGLNLCKEGNQTFFFF
jgi:hypothetical protein